jgi:hypothetical protein
MRILLALSLLAGLSIRAQVSQSIYQDSLQNGWQDWSWATVSLTSTTRVHGGTQAISVSASNWHALYLVASVPVDPASFTGLTFWVNGGASGGQVVQVQGTINNVGQTAIALAPLPTNAWRQVTVSLAGLGFTGGQQLEGFWLQVPTTASVPTFYVDDIVLTGPPPSTNPPGAFAVLVDAAADRHPISPLVYGVNLAGSNALLDLNVPLNRHGGNQTTRYNWKTNASNHALDWYFQSLPQEGSGPGGAVDLLIRDSRDGGALPMVTIPINGWVARLGPAGQRLCSYSIAKYGAQTGNDWEWFPDAGNGIRAATGLPITTNDPYDANQPATTNYQAEWVQHLTGLWGSSTQGGVRYYLMDNEWALWHETHRDVHPVGVTMDQSRDLFCSYAGMVKHLDPAAQVVGPEEFGWSGYLLSGYDLQWGNAHGWGGALPDRDAHGGALMMPWWLNQVRLRSEAEGRRLLDVFSLHFYPQSGEFSDSVSAAMQALRNRSTRSLWDTNYVDESWIGEWVGLFPLMRSWVASNYPGTRLGLTEYSWGADAHMNGGTAQADVLGILGREGVDLATRWVVPAAGSAAYRAFQMFRNYDGARSTFGDVSVRATGPNPDQVAVFAAEHSEHGGLTVVAINKQPAAAATLALALTNFAPLGVAQLWQFASNQPIARLADRRFTNTLAHTLPPQSITTIVLPGAPRLDRVEPAGPQQIRFQLRGARDLTYVTEASSDLRTWQPRATNQLASNSIPVALTQTNAMECYRARWRPE